jgi:hypothetical protein
MSMPNLKRIKINSEQELRVWLGKQPNQEQSVMLVTFADASHGKHVTPKQISNALEDFGWAAGFKYTLHGKLLGHVINR